MGPVEVQRLAQPAERGVHRRQVVGESVRQRGRFAEAGQVHRDHVALGRQDVDDRVPGLPVVANPVQQQERFAAARARVREGHGPRAMRRGDAEGDRGGHGAAPRLMTG